MASSLMISESAPVTREQVVATVTPAATRTHCPIPHNRLLELTETVLKDNGYLVTKEQYALSHGGNRFFALMQVRPVHADAGDYATTIGARNSHDKAFASGLALGGTVTVCDNLCFSAEVVLARKHTSRIAYHLPELVRGTVERVVRMSAVQDRRFAHYKQVELGNSRVNDLVIEALDRGAIAASKIPAVLEQWRTPNHPEFKDRTGWSLFNAFTEVYKRGSLDSTYAKSQALTALFDKRLQFAAVN